MLREDRLRLESLSDDLTGLGNRRAYSAMLKEAMYLAGRYQRSMSLMVADIDDFKLVNDEHGHS